MPAQLKVARLDDERSFLFEEEVPENRALQDVGLGDVRGYIDFEAALATIKDAAESMGRSLAELPSAPSAVEITFGVKLSTQVGAILAKAGGEANFTIKLGWSKPR
jgi:hypothetical protein